jgi:hypothetical protein
MLLEGCADSAAPRSRTLSRARLGLGCPGTERFQDWDAMRANARTQDRPVGETPTMWARGGALS